MLKDNRRFFLIALLDKQVPVPSIYFIGKTGSPLEVVVEAENVNNLLEKVSKILEKHGVTNFKFNAGMF